MRGHLHLKLALQLDVLVATEMMARGIDLPNITYVVNACVPADEGSYLHRAGRAARMGNSGTVISLPTTQREAREVRWMASKLEVELEPTVERLRSTPTAEHGDDTSNAPTNAAASNVT